MKVFIVMYLIVLCFKAPVANAAHVDEGCFAILGAYISAGRFSEGVAAKTACERGEPITVLLQQLQQSNDRIAYRNRIPAVVPISPPINGVTCQNYGYGAGVVCSVY